MIKSVRAAWRIFRKNYQEIRAEQKGIALSRARLVKSAQSVDGLQKLLKPEEKPAPIAGATIRMMDGKPMTFHTDGSLRHALGRRAGKAARKAMKRDRQKVKRVNAQPVVTQPAFGKVAAMLEKSK